MKLSISNIAWEASVDEQMYKKLKDFGFQGIEIAPTRIFPQNPYDGLQQAKTWSDYLLKNYSLKISSMQSIWYGRQERIFGTDEDRKMLVAYTKKAIDFAQTIGCHNLVFGCPKNRAYPVGADLKIANAFFVKIADYALSHNTCIALEANPKIYGTNFINTTEEALTLIRELNKPSVRLNLDVGAMIENGENVDVLKGQVEFINHVHISEPYLKPINRRELHKELALLLRDEGYRGFVSIEMGKVDDIAMLCDIFAYIEEIFR